MRIFISTGEVSGDLQGSLLISALKRQAVAVGLELEILALGGEKMVEAGAILLGNTSSIGSMGILEGLPYILPTLQVQRQAIASLKQNPPDLVVLIDYMTPNLEIGTYMKQHLPDVPVVYYIAPQEWAWSLSLRRTKRIIDFTDKLLAIFPQEARYFREKGAKVSWVGHPLVDRMQDAPTREAARATLGIAPEEIAIALLPASRRQELKYLLPVIFQAAQTIQAKLPEVRFWIPLSLEVYRQPIEEAIERYSLRATVISGQQIEVFAAADLAISKSGTVNLELALLNVPQVVVYRLSRLTAWIARKILKGSITFASPPNLVVMKPIVPEFLQEQATVENITQAAMELLLNPNRREQTLLDYQEMRQSLGEVGVCDRAAQEILQMVAGTGG
ncbi:MULTISPECIES: lipid-A-disaccharide synthase [unclassified Nostoc]|uniref:lipid-A-disaccharide synthase n=1 Tax=unclassified Nostoc TaxID=2593658 RepID=UPI002AD2075D|nr:lipid-A-disaccharide synthase [Nostoc sp. DedQUE03]MDZ7974951.1 lipid-A-disaccharide synthase [Nostoc sp. DedQUE03]MDZ8048641.1 lipid-A-disaccharide synthase [Nostoc sp. DedQUE02]